MLRIGPITLETSFLLAPIAGYCDLAFRTICREQGGVGLACTDLLSPQGLLRGTATSLDLARTNAQDAPVGMQLYGSDPEIMAQGARWAVEHGAAVVDINMGCPVDKVTKKDGGSKLLTDLPRAAAIVRRVREELDRVPLSRHQWSARLGAASIAIAPDGRAPAPLTCKIRLCWHTADFLEGRACSPGLARALADSGVSAVTVHGRTTEDKFAGEVRLDGIARVVEAVGGRIPVIGNGDVRDPRDAARMRASTGCDGIMIGRGALSTPWIFRDCAAFDRDGRVPPEPNEAEKIAIMRRYFALMRSQRGDRHALTQMSRRISWFAKRLGPCRPLREAVRGAADPDAVLIALDQFEAGGLRSREPEPAEAD